VPPYAPLHLLPAAQGYSQAGGTLYWHEAQLHIAKTDVILAVVKKCLILIMIILRRNLQSSRRTIDPSSHVKVSNPFLDFKSTRDLARSSTWCLYLRISVFEVIYMTRLGHACIHDIKKKTNLLPKTSRPIARLPISFTGKVTNTDTTRLL
jgi:hypothetical protein